MPRIVVKMFATIREAAGRSEAEIEAATIGDVLTILKSTFGGKMKAVLEQAERDPDRVVILLNGVNVSRDRTVRALKEGDEVSLFPPVSGG